VRPTVCPVCSSQRIIIVLRDEREILCYDCGSRWLERITGGNDDPCPFQKALPRRGAAAHEAIGNRGVSSWD
jgi:DNA-directed RNA polymerase subunit RPC12/RpoP